MKRHFWLIFFIVLELIYSIALFFGINTIWLLIAANIALFLVLLLEPYWKIGAWLLYLMTVEVFLFVINKMTFRFFVYPAIIFNAASVFCGFILIMIAYSKRPYEYKIMPRSRIKSSKKVEEKQAEKKFDLEKPEENEDEESIDEIFEEKPYEEPTNDEQINEKSMPKSKTLLATGNTIHKKDCWLAKKAKETRIVNERYAKAQKLKECKRCRPYSD